MKTPMLEREASARHAPETVIVPADGWRAVLQNGSTVPVAVWRFDGDRAVGLVPQGPDLVPASELEGFQRYAYRGHQ